MTRKARHGRMGWLAVGLLASLAAACAGNGAAKEKDAATAAPPVLDVGKENTVTVAVDDIITGPVVSGTLAPKTQATVRAEVGGAGADGDRGAGPGGASRATAGAHRSAHGRRSRELGRILGPLAGAGAGYGPA